MKTLLQINTTLNYGSTGRIAEEIGLLARQKGWNCYMAHGPRMKNESRLQTIQVNSSLDEKIHGGWYSLLRDRHGLGSRHATKRLVERLRSEIKPDIIHLHNIHGYYLNYEVLFDYLRKEDIPVVWTLHDCWPFTGHCTHFDFIGCDKWKTQCHHCPQTAAYPKSLFVDNSFSNYRLKSRLFSSVADNLTFIPVSAWLAELLQNSFLKGCRTKVIHNGIDLNIFRPCDVRNLVVHPGLNDRKVILGVASPWTDRKGLKDFIRLRGMLPMSEYVCVVVGVSEKQAAELPDGMIGIRRTQNIQELVAWYAAADVFVNPTYEDNYPTTNLEAMACGTPVITYRTGGSPEALTARTGRVVGQGRLNHVVDAVHSLVAEDRDNLSSECRAHAERCFDREKCFQSYVGLYQELVK